MFCYVVLKEQRIIFPKHDIYKTFRLELTDSYREESYLR